MNLDKFTKVVPNFPKEGIMFKDITPIFENPQLLRGICANIQEQVVSFPDCVVGIESRGLVLAAIYATTFDIPLIMCRKAGKLPGECYQESYDLEYGSATIEIQKDASVHGNVLIIDDIIATGGTMDAAIKLVEKFNPSSISTVHLFEIKEEGCEGLHVLRTKHGNYNHIIVSNGQESNYGQDC